MCGWILLAFVAGWNPEPPHIWDFDDGRTVERWLLDGRGRPYGIRREYIKEERWYVGRRGIRAILHKIEQWNRGENLPYQFKAWHAY